jgi:monofunctional biosynthetic peptidoglycan transglycosylase
VAQPRRRPWRTVGRGIAASAAIAFAAVAYAWMTLPDVRPRAADNPSSTAFMRVRAEEASRAGRTLRIRHYWVSDDRIASPLKRAVLVTEDSRFWQHDGVDYEELRISLQQDWAEGRIVRGASTITQQLARNLYLSPARSPGRKFVELLLARRLEVALTKRRIFEIYLNAIEWGDGIFGVEAASRAYFGISAGELSAPQAALLAGAIASPRTSNPARPSARLRQRQQLILQRMGDVGK